MPNNDKKSNNIEERLSEMRHLVFQPNAMVDLQFEVMMNMVSGRVEDLDPSSSVGNVLENIGLMGCFITQEFVLNARDGNANLANNERQLYKHMSDRDFLDRFSSPAKTKMNFNVLYNEFLSKANIEPDTKDKVFVIPRYYQVKVKGLTYTTMAPIEIRRTDDGVVSIRYILETNDPIFEVNQGYIYYETRTEFFSRPEESQGHNELYLSFDLDLYEIEVSAKTLEVIHAERFSGFFDLPQDRLYYYMRVLHSKDSVTWEDMVVNHAEDIWDIRIPTCLVKVLTEEKLFEYYIPQNYIKSGQVKGWVKFVLYSTKGPVNVDYGEIPISEYSGSYAKIFLGKAEIDGNRDKLHLLKPVTYIEGRVIGGKGQKSVDQLKFDVINNNLDKNIPITEVQLQNTLRNTDLTPVKGYDVVTGREFLVKTKVPSSISEYGIARMSLDMIEYKTSLVNLSDNKNKLVVINKDVVVLPQDTLFENSKEKGLRILNIDEAKKLASLSGQPLVKEVNNRNIMALYYHYVLDASGVTTQLRSYDLSKPRILRTKFKDYNASCKLGVNSSQNTSKITRTPNGYRLDFLAQVKLFDKSISVYNIKPVIVFTTPGGVSFYLEGKLFMDAVDNPIFTFYIDTDGYITDDNKILVRNFKTHTGDLMPISIGLQQDLDLLYYTDGYPKTFKPKEMDDLLKSSYLTGNVAAVTLETHTVEFGLRLKRLYSRVHSSTGLEVYKRHDKIVYHKHQTTKFNKEGEIEYRKGEYVLDEDGNKVVQYQIGDVELDENGKPISVGLEDVSKYLNLMLVDYKVVRANGLLTMSYKDHVRQTINTLVLNNMVNLQEELYNVTEAFLTVPNGLTDITARSDGRSGYMSSAQSFKFFVYVNSRIFNDNETKKSIEGIIKETLDIYLTGRTELSRIELLSTIYDRTKEFVKSIKLDKFTELDGELIKIESDNAEIAIKKKLKVTPDGYDVEDDVSYVFVKQD